MFQNNILLEITKFKIKASSKYLSSANINTYYLKTITSLLCPHVSVPTHLLSCTFSIAINTNCKILLSFHINNILFFQNKTGTEYMRKKLHKYVLGEFTLRLNIFISKILS